jgi:hypothetical protein
MCGLQAGLATRGLWHGFLTAAGGERRGHGLRVLDTARNPAPFRSARSPEGHPTSHVPDMFPSRAAGGHEY